MCVGGRVGGRYLQAVVLRVRLVCPAARLLGVERHVCEVQLVLDCFLTQVRRGGAEGRGRKSERKEER